MRVTAVCGLWSAVRGLGLSAIALLVTSACARPREAATSERVATVAATDSIVGRVQEVGPDPVSWVAITVPGGAQVRLNGAAAELMRSVSGADVWVGGAHVAGEFRADAFEVRAVNDQAVDDGVVVVTPTAVAIRMRSGVQRDVPYAPPALRDMAGARIWVSRPVAGVAPSYGVIR